MSVGVLVEEVCGVEQFGGQPAGCGRVDPLALAGFLAVRERGTVVH